MCIRDSSHTVCVYIDVNGLHELNNKHGHEAGDQMLRAVAASLDEQFRSKRLYRIGGDEFVVFPESADPTVCEARMQVVCASLAAQGYSISYGLAAQEMTEGLRDLVREADEKMLEQKRTYYTSIHSHRDPRA